MNENGVYNLVRKIPKGKVTTYGYIGSVLNINPRQVGRILHNNPDPGTIPCHRIVNYKGELAGNFAFGGINGQRKKLEEEGVKFSQNKIDLNKYLWEEK